MGVEPGSGHRRNESASRPLRSLRSLRASLAEGTGSAQSAVTLGMVAAGLIIAQQVGGKAVRDTLFLLQYRPETLPWVMIAAAIVSAVAVWGTSRLVARHGPSRFVPAAVAAHGALFALEWALLHAAPKPVALALFIHISALGSIAISGFWSVINERFDPHTAKRATRRMVACGALGGALGGIGVERIAQQIALPATLLIFAALNLICALLIFRLSGPPRPPSKLPAPSGLALVRRVPYLRLLGALVVSIAAIEALLDYALKANAAARCENASELVTFFTAFYVAVAILTLAVQTALGGVSLAKLGLAGTIATVPASVIVFGVLGVAGGRLWATALARGVESALASSLFRSAYELLYTPLPAPEKRAGKGIIDVALTRAGDAIGGLIVLVIVAVSPVWAATASISIAVIGALGLGVLVVALHRGYVGALTAALRSGAVAIDPREAHDATTRRTLVETSVMLDRDRLLAAIRELRGDNEAPVARPPARTAAAEAADLLHRMEQDPHDEAAQAALEKLAPRATGQIADALLNPALPLPLRLKLPALLERGAPRRAALALWIALDDPRFELRHRCARALLDLHVTKNLDLEIARRRVIDKAIGSLPTTPSKEEIDLALTILALVFDPEGLSLAARALSSSDPQVRGTAIEYLENVLPSEANRAVKRGLS